MDGAVVLCKSLKIELRCTSKQLYADNLMNDLLSRNFDFWTEAPDTRSMHHCLEFADLRALLLLRRRLHVCE